MRKSVIIILIFAVITIFALLHFRQFSKHPASEMQNKIMETNGNVMNQAQALQPKPSSQSQSQEVTTQINQASDYEKTPHEIITEENLKTQDSFGKVVDQYGQPISDVDVSGVLIIKTDEGFNSQPYSTKTDSDGLFEFTGLHGADFNINIKKQGYYMSERGGGYQAPPGGKSTQGSRVLLTMWKIRGAEQLIGSNINTKIPHDGSPVIFDMTTGKQSPSGNFQVTLSQYPLEVKHGWDKFNWSVKIEILNGGMLEENDAYPFWAPTNEYQSSFEFNESTNAVKWLGGVQRKFYIKTAQGQYGLMQFKVFPGRSPTGFEANFTINPSGSRNLEPAN